MSDYSSNFPTQSPTFAFDAKAGKLDSRISFSRADSTPSNVHYYSNEKHLSSENTQTNSDTLGSTTDYAATLSSGGQVGPDGSATNASLLTGGAGTTLKGFFFGTSAILQTVSFFAKEGTHRYIQLSVQGDSTKFVNFDLNGAGAKAANGSGVTASVSASGNGYLRCAVNLTVPSAGYVYITLQDSISVAREASTASTGTVSFHGLQTTTLGDATNVAAYVATTSQIHREFAPTLKTSAADTPRFEYAADGQSVGTALGLLVESQSSNLFARSSGFDYTAAWTKTDVTATAEAISPDGTLNAFAIRETTGTGAKRIHQAATVAAGSVAVSVYAKLLGNERRLVIREDSTTGDSAVFDLSSGTVAATNVGGAGTIESVGNGWYRCTLITSPSGSPGYTFGFWLATATGTNYESYTGDGFSGVLLYGAMCENASASSSYIASGGSTVTRAADSCSVDSATLFDNGGGTLYAEARRNGIDTYNGIASVDDGTGSGDIVQIFGNSTNFRAEIASGGTTVANIMASGHSAGVYYKHCVSFSSSAAKYYVDGSQKASTDTDLNIPSMSQMHLGMLNAATSGNLNGHIKRVALYNVALSDTELQALTS